MAQQFQLPFGAISPAAKPVDFYIQPSQRNIAQPSQPAQIPGLKGIGTVGTAGTPFVQGSNPYKDLARSLAPFSKALMETATTAGLQFASWQMELGEQAALEQTAEAQARLDEEMETSELNRAEANREVAMRDPQAGGIMNLLNPYRQIGYQRGMAKRAGQEIELGMAGYVASRADELDYNSPDQGFAALQQIRAAYTNQVLEKYGVDAGSPGFSKYTAPRIEKASDAVAQSLQKDRVTWLDEQKPKTIAALIRNEWTAITKNGYVSLNGQNYYEGQPGYRQALKARMNQLVEAELLTGGLPGQALKWQEDVYQILASERDYENKASPLDFLNSNVVMRTPQGEVINDAEGNPRFYSWNDLYAQESIDSKIKYGQARYTQMDQIRKEMARELEGELLEATRGMPAGPERFQVGEIVFRNYVERWERGTKQTMDGATKTYLFNAWKKANETTLTLSGQMDNPYVIDGFVNRINQSFGSSFNSVAFREEMAQIAAGIVDPKLRGDFVSQAEAAISAREKQEDVAANYGQTYRPIIQLTVDQAIGREYRRQNARNAGQRSEGEDNLRAVIEPAVQQALRLKEAELGRRLTQEEAGQIAREAIKAADLSDVVYPDGRTQRDQQDAQKEFEQSLSPTWTIEELADIPNRAVVLRKYRDTRILDSSAIAEAVRNSTRGYGQQASLKRAARDAKAPSLFDFVEAQLKLLEQEVPDYERPWTPEEWRRFRDRNLRSAGLEKSLYATQRLSESRPQLASIQGWIIPSTFQV